MEHDQAFATVNIDDSRSMQKLTLATLKDSAAMKQVSISVHGAFVMLIIALDFVPDCSIPACQFPRCEFSPCRPSFLYETHGDIDRVYSE